MRIIKNIILFGILTLFTQVGGMIYLLNLAIMPGRIRTVPRPIYMAVLRLSFHLLIYLVFTFWSSPHGPNIRKGSSACAWKATFGSQEQTSWLQSWSGIMFGLSCGISLRISLWAWEDRILAWWSTILMPISHFASGILVLRKDQILAIWTDIKEESELHLVSGTKSLIIYTYGYT